MEIGEADWKVLKQVKTAALERACATVLQEIRAASEAPGKTDHERYLGIWGLIRQRDGELAAAFDDYRRSTALARLISLRQGGFLTDEELSRFSEKTRELLERVLPAFQKRGRR